MSRSYRAPYWTDGYGGSHKKWAKRFASKKVRRYKKLSDGKMYRKVSCSYDICDYKFFDNRKGNHESDGFRSFFWQVRRK